MMKAVFKREFWAYLNAPIGYIYIGVFLALSGYFYALNILSGIPSLEYVFANCVILFLFLIPVLTMKILAEEKNQKTDQLLLTAPVKTQDIVLGKFFAALAIHTVTLAITFLYVIVIEIHGKPYYSEIFGTYFGFFLLGAAFISIGEYISSLTENQVISAVSTFGILFLLYVIDWILPLFSNQFIAAILKYAAITIWYEDFTNGILSLSSVVYYLSVIFVFLYLTMYQLDRRRWKS